MDAVTSPGRYVHKRNLLVRYAPDFVAVARVDGSSITLAGSGAAVWRLLDEPRTVLDLARELADVYDAEAARIAGDIEPLLVELAESGFVTTDA
jgi:hypothetical protein